MGEVTAPPPRIWRDVSIGRRAAVLGDSNSTDALSGTSWFKYGAMLSGGLITPKVEAGVSGDNTTDMLARVQADVIDQGVDLCVLLSGTNDTADGIAPTESLTIIQAIEQTLRGNRIPTIITTVPPFSFTGDAHYAERIANYAALNAMLIDWAARAGIPIVDIHAALVSASTNGHFVAAYTTDGTHMSAAGAAVAGQALADVLATVVAPGPPLLPRYRGDPNNLIADGVMVGDSNANGIVDAWTYALTAGTVSASLVAGVAPVIGNWQKFETTVQGGHSLAIGVAAGGSTFAVGDVLAFAGRIRTTGIESGGIKATARVEMTGGGSTQGAVVTLGQDIAGVFHKRFTVPSGVTSLTVRLIGGTTGTGTIEWAQVGLFNLTEMGIA